MKKFINSSRLRGDCRCVEEQQKEIPIRLSIDTECLHNQFALSIIFYCTTFDGQFLFRQGDLKASSFFLIERGQCQIIIDGDSFGERALLYNAPRSASVRAVGDCAFWAIDRSLFRKMIEDMRIPEYEENRQFVENLKSFEFLTYDQRSAISSVLFTVQFKKGEIIVTQGEAATSFFIIKKGSVSVIQDDKEIRKMKKSESFGEMALFQNSIRGAKVKAAEEDVRCLVITRDELTKILGDKIQVIMFTDKQIWAIEKHPTLGQLTELQIQRIVQNMNQFNYEACATVSRREEKQSGHRTLLGTFMACGFYISMFTSLITHDNPTLLLNQAYSEQQPPIYLSQQNFTFTISSLNYDLLQNYNVSFQVVSQIIEDETNQKITPKIEKSDIPLILCELQDGLRPYFVNTSLVQYCIDWSKIGVIVVEGSLDSDFYKYMEVTIKQCEETKCQLIENDEIVIKTLSTYAHTMNYNNPHQLYGKTFKNVINQYYTKRFYGILQITEVKQDQGYILQQLETSKSLSINNLYENFDSQDAKVYATFRQFDINLPNIYPKIQQSLSDFGGLCEIFIIAALIIVTPLNELSYKVTLLNELFNFNLSHDHQESKFILVVKPNNAQNQYNQKHLNLRG